MKVLQLTTYPIVEPRHGGQIRASEIRKKLETEGCEVLSLSISDTGYQTIDPECDYRIDMSSFPNPYNLPLCNDFLTSLAAVQDRNVYKFLEKRVKAFSPDIILCEQPYLWPFVKKIFAEGVLSPKNTYLVYSSQNIESQMKSEMLLRHGVDRQQSHELVRDIALLEKDLVEHADHTICVTEFDAEFFGKYTRKKLTVCSNGVTRKEVPGDYKRIVGELTSNRPYLFLCGSAHSPNAVGFWEMMGPSLACFPPESMIVIAGGLHHILWQYMPEDSAMSVLVNQDIINCVGMVEDEILAALIEGAKGIILPITFGGGSNLKTAEAITSFKPVVSTSTACRGFDFVDKISNFYITDDSREFIEYSRDILLEKIDLISISDDEKSIRGLVYWDNTLMQLEVVLEDAKRKMSLSNPNPRMAQAL